MWLKDALHLLGLVSSLTLFSILYFLRKWQGYDDDGGGDADTGCCCDEIKSERR